MSILNGAYAPETLMPEAQPFGDPFEATGEIKLDKTLDAGLLEAPDGNYLVSAGKNRLEIHRLDKSGIPVFVSALDGLGESRQISISNGFAYITARADGLYVCDLRDPVNPKLAARVDTLELATGVCAADGLLAVTNRHMGCELIDVRDPFHPEWLGSFYCGEAQSVWLYKNLALIGDWMNRRVRIFDITNPRAGVEISSFSVDGFADGVCVVETTDRLHPLGRTLCIAATGHHSAKLKNRRKYQNYSFVTAEMLAEGYGGGHGVEIFDITDPTDPEYVSSIKAPPHFGGYDTWRVFAGEGFCLFTDSMNGIFEIDLSDVYNPRFTRNFRLPTLQNQNPTPPSIQARRGSITGAALVDGFICAAGETGVTILRGVEKELSKPSAEVDFDLPEAKSDETPICKAGQLHSFAELDGRLYCASGDSGIAILDENHALIAVMPTKGACLDIIEKDGLLLSAENDMGVAVYRAGFSASEPPLAELSRLPAKPSRPARELVDCGKYIALQFGSVYVQALRLDGSVLSAVGESISFGLLYHRHLARTMAGEYLITLPLAGGPELIASGSGFERRGLRLNAETCPIEEGACGFRGGLILIFNSKYWYLERPEDITSLPEPIPCPGARLAGLPFVCGEKLVILNRVNGLIEVLDISDPKSPRLEMHRKTKLNPEFAAESNGKLLVACGHGGLIELK